MALIFYHLPIYRELFKIPDFLRDPLITIGFQDLYLRPERPPETKDFEFKHFKDYLISSKNLKEVTTLDFFDSRADFKFDLNIPIPAEWHEKYNTVFDIGTLEHIFDTKQAIENCLRMVKVGGFYFLHMPIQGFFGHAVHITNPECIMDAVELNGFCINTLFYTSHLGEIIKHPMDAKNTILWLLAKKEESMDQFIIPQQRSETSIPKKLYYPNIKWFD